MFTGTAPKAVGAAPSEASATSAAGECRSHRRLTRYSPIMPRIMWSSTWQW